MLYSLGALNTFLITSLFSLLLICGLSRQNQLGSDKERGRDVHNQVIKKSRDFLYIWNICSQSWREEEGRLEFGVWGFCLVFFENAGICQHLEGFHGSQVLPSSRWYRICKCTSYFLRFLGSHNRDRGYHHSHTGNVKTCTPQSIYLGKKSLCSLWKNYSATKFNFSRFFISFPQFRSHSPSSTLSLGALSEQGKMYWT